MNFSAISFFLFLVFSATASFSQSKSEILKMMEEAKQEILTEDEIDPYQKKSMLKMREGRKAETVASQVSSKSPRELTISSSVPKAAQKKLSSLPAQAPSASQVHFRNTCWPRQV